MSKSWREECQEELLEYRNVVWCYLRVLACEIFFSMSEILAWNLRGKTALRLKNKPKVESYSNGKKDNHCLIFTAIIAPHDLYDATYSHSYMSLKPCES